MPHTAVAGNLAVRPGVLSPSLLRVMLSRLRSAHAIDALIAAMIAAGVLAALLATSRDFAMVFDEGFTVNRELTLADWFAGIAEPGPGLNRSDYLRPEVLEQFWRFSRKEPDGHPPFYALIGLAGWRVARGWADPLTSYRFGPMALTAATSGVIYLFLARRFGRLAGVTGALALVLAPWTFAHAHYAALRHAGNLPLAAGANGVRQGGALAPMDRPFWRVARAGGGDEVHRMVCRRPGVGVVGSSRDGRWRGGFSGISACTEAPGSTGRPPDAAGPAGDAGPGPGHSPGGAHALCHPARLVGVAVARARSVPRLQPHARAVGPGHVAVSRHRLSVRAALA